MELTELKGIGPKTEKLFQKLGIRTVEDLVYYFPHTYLSFPKTQVVGSLVDGEQQAVMGMLEKDATVVHLHGSIALVFWAYPITWCMSSVLFLLYYSKSRWLERIQEKAAVKNQ